jgi:hypothetical protein
LGVEVARRTVIEGAGALFDADVVAAFERVLDGGFELDDPRSPLVG